MEITWFTLTFEPIRQHEKFHFFYILFYVKLPTNCEMEIETYTKMLKPFKQFNRFYKRDTRNAILNT